MPKTFATPELRIDAAEETKFEIVKRATEVFRRAGHSIVDVDGVRVIFPDGWGLIRASNTQPILVLRFEAKTQQRLEQIQSLIESTLDKVKNEIRG